LILLTVLGTVPGYAGEQPTETVKPETTAREKESGVNALTDEERADGWRLLFDGQTIAGWRGFKLDEVPPGWGVHKGALAFSGEQLGERHGDLMTTEQFANFVLKLEWKISPGGNSGILYRVTENYEQEFHTGPEFQIIDAPGYPEPLEDWQLSGANYALHPPAKDVVKPAGEWNTSTLVVNGAHVEHWINGEKLVDYELWTKEWNEMVAATKFSEWPDYGMNKAGHIVLQDHGDPVWFRNIRIKVLD
jgi:hypothetical protein